MNNKGQAAVQIGGLIMLAIAVIVGAILLQASAQNVGEVTNTISIANQSISTVVNGTAQYLTNIKSISGVVVLNETGNVVVSATNFTITNNFINPSTGALSVKILPAAGDDYISAWQISGTAEPLTYADSGGRSMATLIIILMALALLSVAVVYAVKNYNQ